MNSSSNTEDPADSESKVLTSLGALPAWSAVWERHQNLARRNECGIVYGTVVDSDDGYRLLDETEGQGALSIPIDIPGKIRLRSGRRFVISGAWKWKDKKQWRWQVDSVRKLGRANERSESANLPFRPGLVPRRQPVPSTYSSVSAISARGGAVVFVVLQRPARVGDGWLIADTNGGKPIARLLLPGERVPYGDQTQLSDEERWKMSSGKRYWVKIRRFRKRKKTRDELWILRAESIPSPYPDESEMASSQSKRHDARGI